MVQRREAGTPAAGLKHGHKRCRGAAEWRQGGRRCGERRGEGGGHGRQFGYFERPGGRRRRGGGNGRRLRLGHRRSVGGVQLFVLRSHAVLWPLDRLLSHVHLRWELGRAGVAHLVAPRRLLLPVRTLRRADYRPLWAAAHVPHRRDAAGGRQRRGILLALVNLCHLGHPGHSLWHGVVLRLQRRDVGAAHVVPQEAFAGFRGGGHVRRPRRAVVHLHDASSPDQPWSRMDPPRLRRHQRSAPVPRCFCSPQPSRPWRMGSLQAPSLPQHPHFQQQEVPPLHVRHLLLRPRLPRRLLPPFLPLLRRHGPQPRRPPPRRLHGPLGDRRHHLGHPGPAHGRAQPLHREPGGRGRERVCLLAAGWEQRGHAVPVRRDLGAVLGARVEFARGGRGKALCGPGRLPRCHRVHLRRPLLLHVLQRPDLWRPHRRRDGVRGGLPVRADLGGRHLLPRPVAGDGPADVGDGGEAFRQDLALSLCARQKKRDKWNWSGSRRIAIGQRTKVHSTAQKPRSPLSLSLPRAFRGRGVAEDPSRVPEPLVLAPERAHAPLLLLLNHRLHLHHPHPPVPHRLPRAAEPRHRRAPEDEQTRRFGKGDQGDEEDGGGDAAVVHEPPEPREPRGEEQAGGVGPQGGVREEEDEGGGAWFLWRTAP